jgi:hypothetical protein
MKLLTFYVIEVSKCILLNYFVFMYDLLSPSSVSYLLRSILRAELFAVIWSKKTKQKKCNISLQDYSIMLIVRRDSVCTKMIFLVKNKTMNDKVEIIKYSRGSFIFIFSHAWLDAARRAEPECTQEKEQ